MYLLQFDELFVALADLPLSVCDAHLHNVLCEGLFLVLCLLDNHLAHCDVQTLLVAVRLCLLAQGQQSAQTLLEMQIERVGLYPLVAVATLHRDTVLYHLLELFHAFVLLLQHLVSAVHLLQRRGKAFVGLEQLIVVLSLRGG